MIARLARSIREYKSSSILAPLFVTLEVVMDVVIPYLMARIIDLGIAAGDMRVVLRIGAELVACALLSLFFGVMSGKYAAIASTGLAANLRRDMYYNVQNFSFANIDKFSPAGLVTRLTTDVANVQNAYQMLLRIMVRSPLMLAFSLAMAFMVNTTVSLVFLGVVPVLGVGLYLITSRAHPVYEKVIRLYDRLNTVVGENLRGIRVVKAFVREEHEIGKFGTVSDGVFRGFSRAEKILAVNSPLMQFAIFSCTLLLSWFGARMIVSASMTTGQLMGLLSYASQILMSLNMLSNVLVMVAISRASAERIVEVLEEKSSIVNGPDPATEVADGSISFRGVDFGYAGGDHALTLKGIGLDIASGRTIGVVGGTGSGKTSLAQLIPRLYDATSGVVAVGGRDVRDYDLRTLRSRVAMVLQKNVLFSGTVRDNLRWGDPNASDADLDRACRLARADEFIKNLPDGYDAAVEQGGTNFSGGQRQRLCIARALLKKPAVLILDDSTSAVDTGTVAEIRRAFRDELPGVTKIIIAQRIASVRDADKIIVLDGGRLNAFGDHDELLATNDIYREMYESQTKREDDGHATA